MPNEQLFKDAAEAIVDTAREAAMQIARDALAAGIEPGEIMQQGFVAGIGQVGELFLPELMMSA